MANKIYDFLPAHLQNKELEDIFDASLERVFSKGSLEKKRAYIGRREKGMNNENNDYMDFPNHLFNRDNYGFEPVFTNDSIKDRVYYDDLLNAMYNKGMLINDHRRLFESDKLTINLPIDADKFVNWQMYYWVSPGFHPQKPDDFVESTNIHYVTIEKSEGPWWSENNSWYHYEDIKEFVNSDNDHLIQQAQRPIIEFDSGLECASEIEDGIIPRFKLVDGDDQTYTIFEYVNDPDLYPLDTVLGISAKLTAGDYVSEFTFQITVPESYDSYLLNGESVPLYKKTEFKYRNLRKEYGFGKFKTLSLPMNPRHETDIDVYVNGIKQIGNYDVNLYRKTVEFKDTVDGDVYVDIATKYNVNIDGDDVWQRLDPILEYNIDNETHNEKPFTYSVFFEHFLRQIEVVEGLEGEANASNNYRLLGNNKDKTRFNHLGSVMIKHTMDVRKGYFAITRDDFDPIKSLEFLSSAYSGFKNRLVVTLEEILKTDILRYRTEFDVLEMAISKISANKKSHVNVFSGSDMIVMGEQYNNYVEGEVEIRNDRFEQLLPSIISSTGVPKHENVVVFLNGDVQINGVDYVVDAAYAITFTKRTIKSDDKVVVRYYTNPQETFIPPSAVKLGIAPKYEPKTFTDDSYTPAVEFIRCHDGSVIPAWEKVLNTETGEYEENPINDIILTYEKLVYNRLENSLEQKINLNHGFYREYETSYSFNEKKYNMYPFFKKWMIRNNISDIQNTNFDIDDWRTWNYRSIDDNMPGSMRGLYSFVYNTEFIFEEPWVVLGYTTRPKDELFGWVEDESWPDKGYFEEVNYKSRAFWEQLKIKAGANWQIPVDQYGNPLEIQEILFNNIIRDNPLFSNSGTLSQDWEFGDASPEELAWRRSSEYPFIEFIHMILLTPFNVLDKYDTQIKNIVTFLNKREGYEGSSIVSQRENYKFKLGSKLGGFVNNLKLFTERNGFSNSNNSEIPSDNYELFVHSGEPNRSESFSAIVLEKVALNTSYPTYTLSETANYLAGETVYREADGKYYKRKSAGQSRHETLSTDETFFDYNSWLMISQPNVTKFGYRISGYDDLNPVFYTLPWDTKSGNKRWRTGGDLAILKQWTVGEYYKLDTYVTYNEKAYISLESHQATDTFDGDLSAGKWKLLKEWPRINTIQANGYKEVLEDQVQMYNYGDVLNSVDEVAHLMVGYQEYLKLIGWDFNDTNEDNTVVDFETLLLEFLDWSNETHEQGDFITLTPLLTKGSFSAPYGVATIGKTPNKNFYRVVDSSGRQLGDGAIKFNTNSDGLTFESTVPVYGIKVDIQDVEHAFVIDREDSYGDIIYDPLSHNRNLRILVDCNRTVDWDGTLAVDGYIAAGNKLLPNLDTMVEDTRYYRDTLVDQSLDVVNRLKESQLGFSPRTYLTNHFVERESQLEFYKGFLAGKSTKQSINRIVNKNSNFHDVEHDEVWAFKLDTYGKILKSNSVVDQNVSDIIENPQIVDFITDEFDLKQGNYRKTPLMTSGYVDPKHVNYVVRNNSILENTVRDTFYEGELAWIRFDEDREWDVKRLCEVAVLQYVGETSDGQLFIGFQTEVPDLDKSVFLKIDSIDIDPVINGYYNLIPDGTRNVNGIEIFEYLVFDKDYEPLIVEIDTTTNDSIYVPTSDQIGVEAVGSQSNPNFNNGDTIVIDGSPYSYVSGSSSTVGGINIGNNSTPNPILVPGEDIGRIFVYGNSTNILNEETYIYFTGASVQATRGVINTSAGDIISIDDNDIIIESSSVNKIIATSTEDYTIPLVANESLSIYDGSTTYNITTSFINIEGDIVNPFILTNKDLYVNDAVIEFIVPAETIGDDTVENISEYVINPNSQSDDWIGFDLTSNMNIHRPGTITIDYSPDGLDETITLSAADYTYNDVTDTITFNNPIAAKLKDDGDFANIVNITVQKIAVTYRPPLLLDDIIEIINASAVSIRAENNNDKLLLIADDSNIELRGSVLIDLGLSDTSIYTDSLFNQLANKITEDVPNTDSYVNSSGKLVIETDNDSMELSGSIVRLIGLPDDELLSTTAPTATSISNQINAARLPGITSDVINGALSISSTRSSLKIEGDVFALGFTQATSGNIIQSDSLTNIIGNINIALSDVDNTFAVADELNNSVMIKSTSSDVSYIELRNYEGSPWDKLGIEAKSYYSTGDASSSAQDFRNQLNEQLGTEIEVRVSTDGRMIFVSSSVDLSFTGTDASILNKIGLFENYTSTTSNTNFKVMRWKSVRYTPNYNFISFSEFENDLGVSTSTKIWADEYEGAGWAVLDYNSSAGISITNKQVQNTVDIDSIKRMLLKDGETYYNYQLYDPLNLKLPGEVMSDLDYIDWQDPARYDDENSNELWLSEHVGEIWWDTNTVRYYRYNDYGDSQGNIDTEYAKRFWGKIVPGSTVSVKQWKGSTTVPSDISWFNTETYWDTALNKSVTKYYYWSEIGIEDTGKEYDIGEIKMILQSEGPNNKFIPITNREILISNNRILDSESVEITVEKVDAVSNQQNHTDWKLVGKTNTVTLDDYYIDSMHNALAGKDISVEVVTYDSNNEKHENGEFKLSIDVSDMNEIAISVNNKFISPLDIKYTSDTTVVLDATRVTLYDNDLIRVYRLVPLQYPLISFADIRSARMNFASIVNDFMKRKLLVREFPLYEEYISLGDGIVENIDWSIDEKFDGTLTFQYLSNDRNIDMITMKEQAGFDSFKVELEEGSEYYTEFDGNLRMVKKEKAAVNINYDFTDDGTTEVSEITQYYENVYSAQTFELFTMLREFTDPMFVKKMFFDMIDYMYTEGERPDWLFKTSYIDLFMFNKPLRQYAIYQNDNFDDVIEYVYETKPYHTKIRETSRHYPYGETAQTSIETYRHMTIGMKFGEYSRYKDNTLDGNGVTELQSGTYEQSGLLRRMNPLTNEAGGYDTGEFDAILKESLVLKIKEDDSTSFYVYDMFGNGYLLKVKQVGTVNSLDDYKLTVNQKSYFRTAKDNTKFTIAIEDANENIEFVQYDSKDEAVLGLTARGLVDGVSYRFEQGDKIYIFETPQKLYEHRDNVPETLI